MHVVNEIISLRVEIDSLNTKLQAITSLTDITDE
jgi:hypothetical protein